jgi:hypothetical protein
VLHPAHRLMAPSTESRTRTYEAPVHPNRESKLPNPVSHQTHAAYAPHPTPPHCTYHLSDHGITTAKCPHCSNSPSTSSYPTYEHGATCYGPQEWYRPTSSGHPGLSILFLHPRSHRRLNASLVRSSFHSPKPLENHSDVS